MTTLVRPRATSLLLLMALIDHLQYRLSYPPAAGDTQSVAAENGFNCQSTKLETEDVNISVSPCTTGSCPPGLSREP